MKHYSMHRESRLQWSRWLMTVTGAICLLNGAGAQAQAIQRIGVIPSGLQLNTFGWYGKLSGDGKFVAFWSATDPTAVVPVAIIPQVFRKELATDAISLVTQTVSGGYGNCNDSNPDSISADGRFVSFTAACDDLVPNDQNGTTADVFVRDMNTGITEIASVSTYGTAGNDASLWSSISADGRFVAFKSYASNLVPNDFNQMPDIFVRDRLLQLTTRINVSTSGAESIYPYHTCAGYWDCVVDSATISGDGRFVAFQSTAANLVSNDVNLWLDVYLHDNWTGTTELVSQNAAGTSGNSESAGPALSFDGRFVAFSSACTDLVPGVNTGGTSQVFVRDRISGTCQLVSGNSAGQVANQWCSARAISPSGNLIAFDTPADNLITPDTNTDVDVFLRDVGAGTTVRLSNSLAGGVCNGGSWIDGMTSDGALVLMDSAAKNMIAGDTGIGAGLALVDRTITAPPITTYCTGKPNSLNCTPAIAPTGLPSISGKYTFFVTATNVLSHRFGALAWGSAPAQTPFMGGTLCIQAPVRRTVLQDSHGTSPGGTSCSGWYSFLMTPQWMQTHGWLAGTTIYGQFFGRDPALAAPNNLSLSNALNFTVVP